MNASIGSATRPPFSSSESLRSAYSLELSVHGVTVGVDVSVGAGVSVGIAVGGGVSVGVAVCEAVGVVVGGGGPMGVGVSVAVKVAVAVGEGVEVEVAVNVRVRVGTRVDVGGTDGVAVIVALAAGVVVAEATAVAVDPGVPGVRVGVTVAEAGGEVAVTDGDVVGDAEASAVGLAARGVEVEEGACVGASVLVIGPVTGSLKQAIPGSEIKRSEQTNSHLGTRPPVGFWLRPITMSPRF